MASTAGGCIGWALADVADQNGTSLVVVVLGRGKYCGGSDTNMVIDLQVWVARTIGSATFIREEPDKALAIVNEGLSHHPDNEPLLKLKALLEQQKQQLEEAGLQERLASLDAMAGAMAHEIKNPLGIVRSTAEILGKRLAP